MIIQVDNFQVHVIRKAIKNLNLRIHANGRVQLSVPHGYAIKKIHSFLEEKKTWLQKHYLLLQKQSPILDLQYQNDETHYFLGKSYTLKIHENKSENKVMLGNKYLHCYVSDKSSRAQRQHILQAWQHEQLLALLPELFIKWENIIGVKASVYRIKNMKSQWGSCQPVNRLICLNLNLIKKPIICLEYVIVHELVHILEASHNQRFYHFMDNFMPNWREYKILLANSE